ncbi:ABC transporter substrate-binding protein [Paenibacillus psychroresistens]|nr:extracellular solute-binding protein [Paenibacillus psychroresistens]
MTVMLIAIVLTFSVLLVGCSTKKETPASSESAASSTADGTAAPTTDGADQKEFTIRVGAWFIDDRTVMKDFKANIEAAYKKLHPKGTIQWEITLGAPYADKLTAQLASASAPDVFFTQLMSQYTEGGFLADLSNEPWAAKLIPSVKKTFTYHATKDENKQYDGKIYGASMGVGVSGYWYNKKIFTDLGITAPKNTAEFFAVTEKIKQAGIIPLALGFKDAWTAQMYLTNVLQNFGYNGNDTYGKDLYDGKKTLDGPEAQAAMQFFQTLKEKDYVNKDALSIDWPQSADLFTKGKAAMIMQGPWMPGAAADNFSKGAAAFELGYFPVSDDKGYYDLSPTTDQQLAVNAKTELMQQAKDLISVILSPEVYAPFENGSGVIPAIDGVEVKYDNPVMNEVLPYVQSAKSHNGWVLYLPQVAVDVMTEQVTKIVSGVKFNPNDLKAAQKKFDDNKSKVILPAE